MKKIGMIVLGIVFLSLLLYLVFLVGLLKTETRAVFEERGRQLDELRDGIVLPPGPNLIPNGGYPTNKDEKPQPNT
jgi:hypothetical protein